MLTPLPPIEISGPAMLLFAVDNNVLLRGVSCIAVMSNKLQKHQFEFEMQSDERSCFSR
jgi:hypothetical protein